MQLDGWRFLDLYIYAVECESKVEFRARVDAEEERRHTPGCIDLSACFESSPPIGCALRDCRVCVRIVDVTNSPGGLRKLYTDSIRSWI